MGQVSKKITWGYFKDYFCRACLLGTTLQGLIVRALLSSGKMHLGTESFWGGHSSLTETICIK